MNLAWEVFFSLLHYMKKMQLLHVPTSTSKIELVGISTNRRIVLLDIFGLKT